jgi:ubiquinol-cytochrome c reductase iron-sulfur subunit
VKWLWSLLTLLLGRGRRSPAAVERRRLIPRQPRSPGGETIVLILLGCAGLCFAGFIAVYALDRLPVRTQLYGLTLGIGFAFVSAALIVASRTLVPVEEISEPYGTEPEVGAQEELVQLVEESGVRVTRKRLLKTAALGTGGVMGAALLAPIFSLGPALYPDALRRDGWRRGQRLMDSKGRPLLADQIETESFYTAFPEGVSHDELWAPLVVVRIDPARLELPHGRDPRFWAPRGILAFSKICTHAGCAIALYRAPLSEPTSARPALVCPCHYSTFAPAQGASVLFGPAGRPLPQLPLQIDGRGELRAAGKFSDNVGPSWWGVRRGRPKGTPS